LLAWPGWGTLFVLIISNLEGFLMLYHAACSGGPLQQPVGLAVLALAGYPRAEPAASLAFWAPHLYGTGNWW
jgi:hypothetical protein